MEQLRIMSAVINRVPGGVEGRPYELRAELIDRYHTRITIADHYTTRARAAQVLAHIIQKAAK